MIKMTFKWRNSNKKIKVYGMTLVNFKKYTEGTVWLVHRTRAQYAITDIINTVTMVTIGNTVLYMWQDKNKSQIHWNRCVVSPPVSNPAPGVGQPLFFLHNWMK